MTCAEAPFPSNIPCLIPGYALDYLDLFQGLIEELAVIEFSMSEYMIMKKMSIPLIIIFSGGLAVIIFVAISAFMLMHWRLLNNQGRE